MYNAELGLLLLYSVHEFVGTFVSVDFCCASVLKQVSKYAVIQKHGRYWF